MVDNDEVDGGGPLGPLDGGSGDDLADAAGATGAEVSDEGLAHRRPEVGGEVTSPEVEDAVDVGVDPGGVERGDRSGEVLDEADVVGVGRGATAVVVEEGDHSERSDDDADGERDAASDTRAKERSDVGSGHDETVPPRRLAGWVAGATLALVGALGFVLAPDDAGAGGRDEVLDQASVFMVDFASYDHDRFDETLAAVEEASIDAFASRYTTLLGGSGFVEAMQENQASATAEITRGPLLAQFGDHEARVFAIVEQTVTSAAAEAPQSSRLRIEVVLVDTPGGWKVVDVETT